jgi:tRNA pseudouridine13 synthase
LPYLFVRLEMPGAKGYLTTSRGTAVVVNFFEVFEVPKFFPTGAGPHLWGLLEKINRNTIDVIREVAEWGAVDARDLGYAGLKDKKARTVQWVSSPGGLPPVGRDFKFWMTKRSGKKLRRGNLLGNWFRLHVEVENVCELKNTVEQLRETGIPNFFGPQRFSKENHRIGELLVRGNKKEAIKIMRSRRIPMIRRYFTFMEDAYCSYLFNRVLSERLDSLEPIEGDILSRFGPTGPIFGRKLSLAAGIPGEIERRILESEGLSLSDFPGFGKRRPLVVPLKGLNYSHGELRFFLPKGCYATLVLREITKGNPVAFTPPTSSSSYV